MSDLHAKNSAAIVGGLRDVNERIGELEERVRSQAKQLQMLMAELAELKKRNMADLVARFGSGPTAG